MKIKAGMNGFGRFGLHLLKYWLDRNEESFIDICFINDDVLSIKDAFEILMNDKSVVFNKYKIKISGNYLEFYEPNGRRKSILYSTTQKNNIPWKGEPKIFFECSGKNTATKDCEEFLVENTSLILISATSWDAQKTLVYGYNHNEYTEDLKIVSYGSCTVNAFVPFANFMNQSYGVLDSDVNVIHNIQQYRMKDNYTLNRKFCTLEKSGPNLLPFLDENNFIVNYSVVPYTGVSMIDFRFRVKNPLSREQFIGDLENAISIGALSHLYAMDEVDIGPEVYNCTTYSTVFIKEGIKVLGDNIYIQGYFDNENSVNRFYDLANYLSTKIK